MNKMSTKAKIPTTVIVVTTQPGRLLAAPPAVPFPALVVTFPPTPFIILALTCALASEIGKRQVEAKTEMRRTRAMYLIRFVKKEYLQLHFCFAESKIVMLAQNSKRKVQNHNAKLKAIFYFLELTNLNLIFSKFHQLLLIIH